MQVEFRSEVLKRYRDQVAELDTRAFLAWALRTFGTELSFATSLGAEDQVLLHLLDGLLSELRLPAYSLEVFTLDTGRLHQETYDLLQKNRNRFRLQTKVFFPDSAQVEELVASGGPNLFYESPESRKACCRVRKVLPLGRALRGKAAWITGLRRSQSPTRAGVERVEWDEANGLWKLNPLLDWSPAQVWETIRSQNLPYNALHDAGFPSIGCAPCTRAVAPGEDERAGRWWWERADQKECGLHLGPDGKLVRAKDLPAGKPQDGAAPEKEAAPGPKPRPPIAFPIKTIELGGPATEEPGFSEKAGAEDSLFPVGARRRGDEAAPFRNEAQGAEEPHGSPGKA